MTWEVTFEPISTLPSTHMNQYFTGDR